MLPEEVKELEDSVARGVKLLDRVRPNWRIELRESLDFGGAQGEDLTMTDCRDCVVGRLMQTNYHTALRELFPSEGVDPEIEAGYHGFNIPESFEYVTEGEGFRKLEELWMQEIKEKKHVD